MPRLLSGFLCTAKPDFFALLNQISLHCSTNFFVVTKLDSSEPTWAGEVGGQGGAGLLVAFSAKQTNIGPRSGAQLLSGFHTRCLAKCADCGAECRRRSGMRKHNKQQQQEWWQERRNNGGIPTAQSFLERTINVSAVSSC